MTVLEFVDEVATTLDVKGENIIVCFFDHKTTERTTTYAEMVRDVSFYKFWTISSSQSDKIEFTFFYK